MTQTEQQIEYRITGMDLWIEALQKRVVVLESRNDDLIKTIQEMINLNEKLVDRLNAQQRQIDRLIDCVPSAGEKR